MCIHRLSAAPIHVGESRVRARSADVCFSSIPSRKNPLVKQQQMKKKRENVKCTGGMKCYKIKALSEFHFQLLDSV